VTSATSALYGLLGSPVEHSLSPAMMTAAFGARAMDAVYLAFEVRPDALGAAVAGLRVLGARGLNVTLPHKETVVPLLDELASSARTVGAVNTIVVERGRLIGHNTDASGFVEALREAEADPLGGHAVLLGAGGAARAVAAGLARAGAASITIAGRAEARAQEIVTSLRARSPGPVFRATSLESDALCDARTTLLVNCTPAGMDGGPDGDALAASLPLDELPASATVVDLVYRPLETPLLARAEARGVATLGGLTMLLHQGAAAFHLWTGRVAPLDAMRRALDSAAAWG
jgi:shikimate dehydrogenase